jgi:hypothetical protein
MIIATKQRMNRAKITPNTVRIAAPALNRYSKDI